jgi:hypothetical protein
MLVWRSPATAPTPTTREPPDARFSGTLCPKRQAHQTRELSQRTGHDRLIGPPRVWSTKQPLPLPMATRHSASARRRRPTFCSFRLEGAAGESRTALLLVPQRDSDDFELGPTDSSRVVDVVPMHGMQRGRAERRFRCSSIPVVWRWTGDTFATTPGRKSRPSRLGLELGTPRRVLAKCPTGGESPGGLSPGRCG